MRSRFVLMLGAALLATVFTSAVPRLTAQTPTGAALTGVVSSSEEGKMEGVLVTARREGANFTVTAIVADPDANFIGDTDDAPTGNITVKVYSAGNVLLNTFTNPTGGSVDVTGVFQGNYIIVESTTPFNAVQYEANAGETFKLGAVSFGVARATSFTPGTCSISAFRSAMSPSGSVEVTIVPVMMSGPFEPGPKCSAVRS